ncbi:MAG: DNA polymerase III subunit beta [Deltaproteobacteria bacterium]|nr:DNA polymerase III subunit beta [Deltaproteobacteria bacterium]
MEIKIQREALVRGLYLTQSVIEYKSTMPILSNAVLEAKGKSVNFTATDLQVGIIAKETAEVINPGKVLVPVKNIYEIAKELQGEMVTIKTLSNNWIEVVSGKSKFKIMGAASDDFPSLPASDGQEINFEAKLFIEMIDKVSYAMSNDETRYALNGVYIEQVGANGKPALRMAATDGHRLSYTQRPLKGSIKLQKGVILPKKGVWEIAKILKDIEGDISLKIGEKTLSVSTKNVTFVCRLIDGQFPPYEQVIPKDNNKVVSIDRLQLAQSLRRASLVANEKSKGVKLSISPGNLDISSSNPDIGEAREELTCVYKGETSDVGFNATYFIDILSVLEDDKAILELKNDTSPCVIRSEFDKGFLSVVMPMRI